MANLIRSLNEYVLVCKERNWLIRSPSYKRNLLPNTLLDQLKSPKRYLPTPPTPSAQITNLERISETVVPNDSQLVLDNLHLVGQGSHFHRTNVQSYLKPLGFDKLRRSQDVQIYYDHDTAERNYSLSQSDSKMKSVYDGPKMRSIVQELIDITPKSDSLDEMSPIQLYDDTFKYSSPLGSDVYDEIPPLPDFQNDPRIFEQYIYLLTHSTFHYKNSSKFNGIIPKLLKNLFHPLNSNTLRLRTVNSFNYAIHYYSLKWDIATCRELLVQMKFENLTPSTSTYNLFLKNILTLKNIKHVSNEYNIVLKLLEQMKTYGLKADIITWNLIFKIIDDESYKALLLENRKLLNIPLDRFSISTIMGFLTFEKQLSAHALAKYLSRFGISFDRKLLVLLLRRLLDEEQYDSYFKIVEHGYQTFNYRLPQETLNLLLKKFSNQGRVDLLIATINTFTKRYDLKPDIHGYSLVFKGLATKGYWQLKYPTLRIVYHDMLKDCKGIIGGEYWIRRLRSRLKFIHKIEVKLSDPLNETELKLSEDLKKVCFEDYDNLPINLKGMKSNYRKFGAKLGLFSRKMGLQSGNTTSDKAKKKVKAYKKKIGTLSIQKSLIQRIPYAKDPFQAIKDELRERNLT